ncbi:MAG: membrane protein insertase YidC [Spirochaetaceae bacterium]|jgi:YidC/Oxa1 family membrane protein insertase|nr:membrane protein insertase YidC [Spirochaetaceae bacterium]
MEKRTLLAIVLSVIVISGFYVIQGVFFPPYPQSVPEAPVTTGTNAPQVLDTGTPPVSADPAADFPAASDSAALADSGPVAEQRITIDTNLISVILTNAGGDIVSFKLKEHREKDDFVEMVLSGDESAGAPESHAFTVAFGNLNAQPVSSFFYVNRVSEHVVEFYRDFTLAQGGADGPADDTGQGDGPGRFRLTKRYTFKPDEYMFELAVSLDGGRSVPSLNFSGAAYTLGFGPQIGPQFAKLDQRYEYRRYYTYTNGKQREEKVKDNLPSIITSRVSWAAIAGKYFTFIAIPDATQYELAFSTKPEPGIPSASRFYMSRPPLNGSRTTDTYRFYLGPKSQNVLGIYDNGNNNFNLRDMQLSRVANTSGFLAPLETVLKWFLSIFYRVVPNYGVAIILLTLLVKLLLFPLTKKSSESTLRMQTLSPKIKELQDKYKDNPQKMNAEMADLYKKEGYNPLSGCLPMLLQFPIFIAMYNLFNNHFDLRGALFIPGWIPDLSMPESVYSFAPFQLPILGWSDIRLLPFIYVGSQLLFGKITQTPDQQGNSQMKIMLYAMPVIFFFILYDVPSGLTVYWIMTNLLSMLQQLFINKYLAQKRAAMAASTPEPVIAPKKKKKR